jgi:hypothetical protein
MPKNAQDVNNSQVASTSDGVPRPNGMTREEFLRRVLYSGEITKLAQHIALVICLLAEKGSARASVRDLERITGWTRQAIRDHLGELDIFMKVTLGIGRAKSHFELQGAIEDAFATAIVSGSMVKRVDAKADAKLVAKEVDASCGQPDGHKRVVANQPDAKMAKEVDAKPEAASAKTARSITTRATKESPSEIVITPPSPNGEGERFTPAPAALARSERATPHMNGVGFVISKAHGLFIPADIVGRWRDRFPAIPDLEAAMQRLATKLLHHGTSHPGWTCPDGWMVGVLADMNAEFAEKKRIADAKIASTQRNMPMKTYKR